VLSGTLKIDGAQENQALALLCVANGVTTVRNMWGDSVIDALGREIDSGRVLGWHTPWVLSLMATFQSGKAAVGFALCLGKTSSTCKTNDLAKAGFGLLR